ncbi:hypothetical protein [Fulvimarina sp. MAC3]|uniref:DUF4153 domain-containing protein n=1 Tax=Fulvimarina sp. MAC3 TaxID=3148887 RepID=UPI0031FD43BD
MRRFKGRFTQIARSVRARTQTAATRFPVAVLAIFCASLAANAEIADALPMTSDALLRLESALFSAAAAAIAATLASEAYHARRGIDLIVQSLAAILVAAGVWYGLRWGIFAPALIGGILLAIPLAPYLRRGDGLTFWTFAAKMIVGGAFAFAAVIIFVTGVLAIIYMIGFLFEFEIEGSIDTHIFITALTLVGPWFVLGQIPKAFDDRIVVTDEDHSVRAIALLAGWVSAPLALVAALVLYLYGAKIIVTGDVPKGEIGWIVSVFALLTVSLRIAAEPIEASGGAALRLFCRIWPWTLVLPLGLLAYAVWLRIDAEGLTVSRYYLALGGISAGMIALVGLISGRRLDIRWLVAIPAALCLMSSFGPQGVAQSVGRSQTDRLQALFKGDLKPETTGQLSDAERRQARSRIYALDNVDQLDRLASIASAGRAVANGEATDASLVIEALGLQAFADSQALISEDLRRYTLIDTAGYDRFALSLTAETKGGRGESEAPTGNGEPSIWLDGDNLVVDIAGMRDRFALTLTNLDNWRKQSSNKPAAPMTLRGEGGRTLGLVPVRAMRKADGAIVSISGHLLYTAREWR